MFNNISWQGYWTTIALLTAGYYLSIYLLYFRNDFKVLSRGKATEDNKHSYGFVGLTPVSDEVHADRPLSGNDEESQTLDRNSEEAVVYACIDELDAFFNELKKGKCLKEEIISSLHSILNKYPSLKTSGYKASVTNVIIGQCEHICSIHLKADEVDRVWFG
jgi:hypothetical protein